MLDHRRVVRDTSGIVVSELKRNEDGIFQDIPARIREMYAYNCFMADYFHINIDEIGCGNCQVSLHIEYDKHSNHRNVVHGGVMTALADAVLGVTGASVGEVVVTASFSMDFIRNTKFDSDLRMVSHVKHHGRMTMVIVGEMYDEQDRLVATMMASMMNVGKVEGIPRNW